MSKGSGITRGDRRRNARLAALRAMVPAANAVAGLDLGEKKQALAVTGTDGQVLARRSPKVSVHGLGSVCWTGRRSGRGRRGMRG
jgi:transposase